MQLFDWNKVSLSQDMITMATRNWTIADMQLFDLKQSIHLSRHDNNGYKVIEQLLICSSLTETMYPSLKTLY